MQSGGGKAGAGSSAARWYASPQLLSMDSEYREVIRESARETIARSCAAVDEARRVVGQARQEIDRHAAVMREIREPDRPRE